MTAWLEALRNLDPVAQVVGVVGLTITSVAIAWAVVRVFAGYPPNRDD